VIHTDGKPTIAHRGSLPGEAPLGSKSESKKRYYRELAEQRRIDREVAKLVSMKVLV
jgi:hypothetical protein